MSNARVKTLSTALLEHGHISQPLRTAPRPPPLPPPVPPPSLLITDDWNWTLRPRQHGNKYLALPPLMDPIATTRKTQYKTPKLYDPDRNKTTFQQELENDIHAQALATPIRTCALTGARLPSQFLLPVVLRLLPQAEPESEAASVEDLQRRFSSLKPKIKAELIPEILLSSGGSSKEERLVSPQETHIAFHPDVFAQLGGKKSPWTRLASERLKKWYSLKMGRSGSNVDVKGEWTWDLETADKVLRQLRAGVKWQVEAGFLSKYRFLRTEGEVLRMQEMDRGPVACLLKLQASELNEAGMKLFESSPPLPAYDLTELLGHEMMPAIPQDSGGVNSWLAVIRGKRAQALQFDLLKLEAFLGASEDM